MKAPSELNHRILAIDTSSRAGVVVLADIPVGQFQSVTITSGLTHGRELVPTIQQIFQKAGLVFSQLDAIAVGIGPGSYTGLRVGMAVAKTLAEVVDKPCLAIDSLILPVLNLPEHEKIAVSIADAQRGAIYEAVYEKPNPGIPWYCIQPPCIRPWSDLNRWSKVPEAVITGPGLVLSGKLGMPMARMAGEEIWSPSHEGMQRLLAEYLRYYPEVDRYQIEPLYIRPSAAEEKLQEKLTNIAPPSLKPDLK